MQINAIENAHFLRMYWSGAGLIPDNSFEQHASSNLLDIAVRYETISGLPNI
jgi:hypothetical protein